MQRPAKPPAEPESASAALDSLAHLLATRDRSTAEARQRLIAKGYSMQAVAEALERAQACELLNDERFALSYLKGKISLGWGERRIGVRLRGFGVSQEIINALCEDYLSAQDQVAHALCALRKHRSRSKNPRQAAYQFLVSKGYAPSVAQAALSEHLEQEAQGGICCGETDLLT